MTDTVILDYSREVTKILSAIQAASEDIAKSSMDQFIGAAMQDMLASVRNYIEATADSDGYMEGKFELVPLSRARLAGISHLLHRWGAAEVAVRIMTPVTAAEEAMQKAADRKAEEARK